VKAYWCFVTSQLYCSDWGSSEIGRCTTRGKGYYFPFGGKAYGSPKMTWWIERSVLPSGIESRFSGCRSVDLVYGELVVNPRCLGWLQCSSVYWNLWTAFWIQVNFCTSNISQRLILSAWPCTLWTHLLTRCVPTISIFVTPCSFSKQTLLSKILYLQITLAMCFSFIKFCNIY
jgi:hypothetical protein